MLLVEVGEDDVSVNDNLPPVRTGRHRRRGPADGTDT
jgi:hypothetical protein